MTILQLSKRLDISKSGVHYYIKQLELSPSKNKSGAIILSDEECTLISDAVQSTRINNADDVHTNMHSNVHSDAHTNNTDTQTDNVGDKDNNKNTTSNNDDEYIQALKDHIESLKNEVSSKKYTIEDYSKKLDKAHELLSQQQSLQLDSNNKISKLENEVEQYKLEDSSNSKRVLKVKSRVKVNDVEDADVKDVDNTNIDNVKEDKPKGFFAKLFNL